MPKLGHDPFISCCTKRAWFGDLRAHHHKTMRLAPLTKRRRFTWLSWSGLQKDVSSCKDTFRIHFPNAISYLSWWQSVDASSQTEILERNGCIGKVFHGVLWVK
ncbi:hypothetical protein FOXYSP1_00225 [Fusarium oxysporum f. sp. phaseoli]